MAEVVVTFAGSGDAFGSGGRFQACIHIKRPDPARPVLLECGATSLTALKRCCLDPGEVRAVVVSHLHGDHFGGLPFLILDGQFSRRKAPLTIIGPPGMRSRLEAALECMFPGASQVRRRFVVDVIELEPGSATSIAGLDVTAWKADHPSGAPALVLRLALDGRVIAYTGDTAWTESIIEAAAGADLLIAEAYYRDKKVPYHLRLADLDAHRADLGSDRIVLTHMSEEVLASDGPLGYQRASDGMTLRI